jgi:hypothetical protein
VNLESTPARDGYYSGVFYPRKKGTYAVSLENPAGEEREYLKVTVELPEGEFKQMTPDAHGCAEAVQGTGGRVFSTDSRDDILQSIRTLPGEAREETLRTDTELFNHPLFFVVIIAGAALEWILRKLYRLN